MYLSRLCGLLFLLCVLLGNGDATLGRFGRWAGVLQRSVSVHRTRTGTITYLFLRGRGLCQLYFSTRALGENKDALLLTVDDRAIDVADGKAAHFKAIARLDKLYKSKPSQKSAKVRGVSIFGLGAKQLTKLTLDGWARHTIANVSDGLGNAFTNDFLKGRVLLGCSFTLGGASLFFDVLLLDFFGFGLGLFLGFLLFGTRDARLLGLGGFWGWAGDFSDGVDSGGRRHGCKTRVRTRQWMFRNLLYISRNL